MDELEIKGKKYISAKRASEVSGYAKDYVGQLARSGKLEATKFGKAWYVSETALLAHMGEGAVPAEAALPKVVPATPKKPILSPALYAPYTFPKTWAEIKYLEDESDILPVLSRKPETVAATVHDSPAASVVIQKVAIEKKVETPSASVTKRIASLEGVIAPKSAIVRLPQKNAQIDGVRPPSTRKRDTFSMPALSISLYPVILGVSALFFVFAASGLFFASETLYTPSNTTYTASVLPSFEHIWDILRNSPLMSVGISGVTNLFQTIGNSFWAFFKIGIDFLKTL